MGIATQPPWPDAAPPVAPPIAGGPLIVPRRPVWPTVIGVILIVIASLGLLAYAGSAVVIAMGFTGLPQSSGTADSTVASMERISQTYLPWRLASAGVLAALAGLLLACGVGLLRRRPWSRTWCQAWAVLRIVVAFPSAYLEYLVASEMFSSLANDSSSGSAPMPGMMGTMMEIGMLVGMVLQLLFTLALPVFILIWFNRPAVKAEIASWAAAGAEWVPGA